MQTPSGPEARDGRTKAESTPLDLQEENLVPKKSQGKRKSNYKSLKRGQAKPPEDLQEPLLQGREEVEGGSMAHTHLGTPVPGCSGSERPPCPPDGSEDLTRKEQGLVSFLGV